MRRLWWSWTTGVKCNSSRFRPQIFIWLLPPLLLLLLQIMWPLHWTWSRNRWQLQCCGLDARVANLSPVLTAKVFLPWWVYNRILICCHRSCWIYLLNFVLLDFHRILGASVQIHQSFFSSANCSSSRKWSMEICSSCNRVWIQQHSCQ